MKLVSKSPQHLSLIFGEWEDADLKNLNPQDLHHCWVHLGENISSGHMRKRTLAQITNFKINGDVEYLNCLLLGQAASGKTSFFNTVATAIKDERRVLTPLTVYKASGGSVTSSFETHPLYTKSNDVLKLRLFDCRGLHDISGVKPQDVRYMVDGKIRSGYKINPACPISESDPNFRPDPSLGDMMHCIVYVVNAENPSMALASEMAAKIFEDIRSKLAPVNVPQFVLMNKADRLRGSLSDDISDVFRSKEVYEKLKAVAEFMNLTDLCVLPMSNYHDEDTSTMEKDVLALANMKSIMDRANDFVQMKSKANVPSGFYN